MLIINANILTMSGPDINNGYVEIKDGRIKSVGRMSELEGTSLSPDVINLNGKYLLPGFVDAHCHLGMCEEGVGFEGDDINECSDPLTPHLRALDAINPIDRAIAEALEGGVTCAVASPGSSNSIGGQLCAFKTTGRHIDRMLVAEPLAMKFAFGENPKQEHAAKDRAPMSRMANVAIIREALKRTQRYMADSPEQPELDFKCEALIPLLEGKQRVHMHAHRAYDILSGLRIAKEFGLDPTIIHATEGHLIADILAEQNVRVICGPMLATRSKPELSNMEANNAAILARHGIEIAICSDHPETPSRYLSTCAAVACAEGLDERKALLAITLWAAKAVGLEHRIGSIEAGKDADLLVFADHPLHRLCRPEMVFVDGARATLS